MHMASTKDPVTTCYIACCDIIIIIAYINYSLACIVSDKKHCQSERQDHEWCWSKILPQVSVSALCCTVLSIILSRWHVMRPVFSITQSCCLVSLDSCHTFGTFCDLTFILVLCFCLTYVNLLISVCTVSS